MSNNRFCQRILTSTIGAAMLLTSGLAFAQSPWDALGTFTKEGQLGGYFKNDFQNYGTYEHRIEVYKLDDNNYSQGDWYRIDYTLTSAISRYRKGSSICGWFTHKVTAAFDLETSNGSLYEAVPPTTSGSSSKSFSLGTGLSTSGPNVSAGYSISQTTPDEGIKQTQNTVQENVFWDAKLKGCDLKSISGKGASKLAKTTYTFKSSVIVEIPEAAVLAFATSVGGTTNRIIGEKHKQKNITTVTRYIDDNTSFDYTVTCDSSKTKNQCIFSSNL